MPLDGAVHGGVVAGYDLALGAGLAREIAGRGVIKDADDTAAGLELPEPLGRAGRGRGGILVTRRQSWAALLQGNRQEDVPCGTRWHGAAELLEERQRRIQDASQEIRRCHFFDALRASLIAMAFIWRGLVTTGPFADPECSLPA